MPSDKLKIDLIKICQTISKMVDKDIFVWLNRPHHVTEPEIRRAATIIVDRLCGAVADPIIRNEQEKRQLSLIAKWLMKRGYREVQSQRFDNMEVGTFSFRKNIPIIVDGIGEQAKISIPIMDGIDENVKNNIAIDVMIMPLSATTNKMPLLIEAKSAGDFTNVNKRRKEEAKKMSQLRYTYGSDVRFALFLCGYFDSGYLGYEAAEGIDWVWEHRIDDLQLFGL